MHFILGKRHRKDIHIIEESLRTLFAFFRFTGRQLHHWRTGGVLYCIFLCIRCHDSDADFSNYMVSITSSDVYFMDFSDWYNLTHCLLFLRNQWFPQFQKWRGRTKQPRPVKPKFDLPPKQNGTQSIRLSTHSMSRPSSGPPTPRVSKVQNGAPAVYTANPTGRCLVSERIKSWNCIAFVVFMWTPMHPWSITQGK